MLLRMRSFVGGIASGCAVLALICIAGAQVRGQNSTLAQGEAAGMHRATGSFEVKMAPQKPDNPQAQAAALGRMSLDKQLHGDLEATSQGEMLSVLDQTKGSGGYVALERVTGTLQGRSGSFVLQHNATMNRGVPQLNVVVVPDSGTGELSGISGSMTIRIEGGKHFYDFEYTLAPPQ
jgi:hypothetical protein